MNQLERYFSSEGDQGAEEHQDTSSREYIILFFLKKFFYLLNQYQCKQIDDKVFIREGLKHYMAVVETNLLLILDCYMRIHPNSERIRVLTVLTKMRARLYVIFDDLAICLQSIIELMRISGVDNFSLDDFDLVEAVLKKKHTRDSVEVNLKNLARIMARIIKKTSSCLEVL